MTPYRLLGPVSAGPEAAPLPLGGPRQRAVLAMLLLSCGRFVPDERLLSGIGSEEAPTALSSLRTYVSALRRALGPVIERRGSGYLLLVAEDQLDLSRFRDVVGQARRAQSVDRLEVAVRLLADAEALWTGPAMADLRGLAVGRSAAPALDEERASAIDLSYDLRLSLGHHTQVVADLWAAANASPLRERRWALLVLALYRCGQQADALQALGELRRALRDELGIDPSPDLRRLETAVLQQAGELEWRPPAEAARQWSPTGQERHVESSLIGREDQVHRLLSLVETRSHGSHAVIRGEAGIGKSALVAHVRQRLRAKGALVLCGACDPHVAAPLGPVGEALSAVDHLAEASGADPGGLALLLPGLAVGSPVDGVGIGSGAAQRQSGAALSLLECVLRAHPSTLIIIEDLQWADPLTLALLTRLRRSATAVNLITTTRCLQPTPHECPADLDMTLGPLTRQDTDRVLRSLDYPRPLLDDGTAWVVTRGIPFYVVALSSTRPGAAGDVPRAPDEVLDLRLDRLDREALALLTTAVVLGTPFRLLELAAMVGRSPSDVVRYIEPALEAGLLHSQGPGRLAFTHDLLATRLRLRAGPSLVASMHESAADAVLERGTPQARVERWRHLLAAGSMVPAPKLLQAALDAFDVLTRAGAVEDASTMCQSTLDVVDEPTPDGAELLVRWGTLLARSARPDDAVRVLERAVAVARQSGALHLLVDVVVASDPFDAAVSVTADRAGTVRSALDLLGPAASPSRLTALVALGAMEHRQGRTDHAFSLLRESEACSAELRTPVAASMTAHLRHLLHRARPPAALTHGERSATTLAGLQQAVRSGNLHSIMQQSVDVLTDALEVGTAVQARHAKQYFEQVAEQLDEPLPRWVAACADVVMAQIDGDLARADRLAVEVFQLGKRLGVGLASVGLGAQLFVNAKLGGRLASVHPLLATQADANLDVPAWQMVLALAELEAGDRPGATRRIAATGGVMRLPDDWLRPAGLLLGAEVVAELGGPDDPAELLAELAPWVDQQLVVGSALVSLGPVRRVTGLLRARLGDRRAAAADLLMAVETCLARGVNGWAAYTFPRAVRLAHDASDLAQMRRVSRIAVSLNRSDNPEQEERSDALAFPAVHRAGSE